MQNLNRDEAVKKLRTLVGQDLRRLANEYGVTVFKYGRLNKGWAGHVIQLYLGLPLDSRQAPDTLGWELKVVPLVVDRGVYVPKETMAITMIDADDVLKKSFEASHLFEKLRSMIVCGRLFVGRDETSSVLLTVGTFDLVDQGAWEAVKRDYELVRNHIRRGGFQSLSGRMGKLVQPRTKGPGHGSTSRAFYARKEFVTAILSLHQVPQAPAQVRGLRTR